jgi:alpha-tubulin suppressor-like RCC1 family protein
MTVNRARPRRGRRRFAGAALIPLAVILGSLMPQAAIAQSQAAAGIAAGNAHSCALENGRAYCWGENDYGQLGDGSTTNSSVPVPVTTAGALAGKKLTEISAGGGGGLDTCALDSTGTAYCWGSNYDGALGDGSTAASSAVPVAVATHGALAGQQIAQISTGSDGACALDTAGAAYCWGDNDFGEVGDGTTASSSSPVAVYTKGALAGRKLTQISAGYEDSCALDTAGAAYCWGDNSTWELGDGQGGSDGDYSSVPVPVRTTGALAGKTLTQISAGWSYGCALDTAGAAYCWGSGPLGSTETSSVPVAVDARGALAGHPLAQISAGLGATCALAMTGTAYCWGDNTYGELGDGSTVSSVVPVAVDNRGALAGKFLAQVAAGAFHACAADDTGAIYCWGDNNQGDLGDDRGAASDVPVLVGPQAPARVTAVPGDKAATVSWTAPASLDGGTLTGYTATASPGGAACMTTATTCTITGLSNGTRYSVTVIARSTVGNSGASSAAVVTPQTGQPAGPIVSGYRPGTCLQDNHDSAANDTQIVMWSCAGTAAQRWTIGPGSTLRINGKCMDIYRDEKTNRAPVELWTCTGGANQQWRPAGGTLVNPVSGKCLDDPRYDTADGIQAEIYTCNGGANQQWRLPAAAIGDGRVAGRPPRLAVCGGNSSAPRSSCLRRPPAQVSAPAQDGEPTGKAMARHGSPCSTDLLSGAERADADGHRAGRPPGGAVAPQDGGGPGPRPGEVPGRPDRLCLPLPR